jgi:hypothetical protein
MMIGGLKQRRSGAAPLALWSAYVLPGARYTRPIPTSCDSTAGTLLWFSVWPMSLVLAPQTAGVPITDTLGCQQAPARKQHKGDPCTCNVVRRRQPMMLRCEACTPPLCTHAVAIKCHAATDEPPHPLHCRNLSHYLVVL